jgi:hypothetical protein
MIGVAAPASVSAASSDMIGVPAPGPAERRAEPRVRASAPARLFYGAGHTFWIDCLIKDRSKSGAKVQAPALFQLPQDLILLDFELGFAFAAQLRWRKAELAGLWLPKSYDLRVVNDPALAEIRKVWETLGPGLGYR